MKCPFCGYAESKVIDSRPAEEGNTIRRKVWYTGGVSLKKTGG